MDAPESFPSGVNLMSMNFPNRDELSFRMVRAFPNDSRMGLDCSTCCSMDTSSGEEAAAIMTAVAAVPGAVVGEPGCR